MSEIAVSTPAWTALGGVAKIFSRWTTSRDAYPLGYLPALDGIRGLMTIGVLVAHTRMALFGGAIVFMDVFFTMSGYLITSLLIADYQKSKHIRFKKFYLRRYLRLYPALIAMLLTMLCVALVSSSELESRLIEIGVAFAYLTDYWRALGGPGVYYTAHLWSLAVEEQFYVLWPPLFALLLWRLGISWPTVWVIASGAIGFAVWRIWLTSHAANVAYLYNALDMRADALLVGCGMAVTLKLVSLDDYPRLSRWLMWSLLPIFIGGVIAGLTLDWKLRWYYYVSPLLGAIPGAVIIAAILQPNRNFMHRLYEHSIPVFCGRICYGLYVWHFPIFAVLRTDLQFHSLGVVLIGWPLVFALAIASYYLIERRFMRARPL
jgi:peptidoglycan/LPS O-acetylase OafA/YrhL